MLERAIGRNEISPYAGNRSSENNLLTAGRTEENRIWWSMWFNENPDAEL
jgi:hypothetical protein